MRVDLTTEIAVRVDVIFRRRGVVRRIQIISLNSRHSMIKKMTSVPSIDAKIGLHN